MNNSTNGSNQITLQKRMALFSALAGYGRCSITVSLPVISHLGIECCPLPTAILSNNSGFPEYFMEDYSDRLPAYIEYWKKLQLSFDGICTGFLGSRRQISIVRDFIHDFRTDSTIIVVDPVLGDHGRLYTSCSTELRDEMKSLVALADIITPNITEACCLTGTGYHEGSWSLSELDRLTESLRKKESQKIVITGISNDDFISNYISIPGEDSRLLQIHRVGCERNGTGDIFTAVIASDAVNQVPFPQSVCHAQDFIVRCITASDEMDVPKSDGVCFEKVLNYL